MKFCFDSGRERLQNQRCSRSAFTLMEILIVVAIMGFLMSAITVAVMSSIGASRVAATKSTVLKVQGLLQLRIDAVTKNEINATDVAAVTHLSVIKSNPARAKAVLRKIRFRNAFPQTWAEVLASPYVKASLPTSPAVPMDSGRKQESAEVLYFLLTKANIVGYPPEGEAAFLSSEVQDTDSNGWPEIVDSWEQPLRFYRWPTALVAGSSAVARALIPSLPADLTKDGDDPSNSLSVGTGRLDGIKPAELNDFILGTNNWKTGGRFHTPQTTSLPLILSAGPDLQTGLFEPNDLANFGFLGAVDTTSGTAVNDDISNYNIRSGGK